MVIKSGGLDIVNSSSRITQDKILKSRINSSFKIQVSHLQVLDRRLLKMRALISCSKVKKLVQLRVKSSNQR